MVDMYPAIPNPFLSLWDDLQPRKTLPETYLAHYTGIDALEGILKHGEVWFSNPLYTNDTEELGTPMSLAKAHFEHHEGVKAACTAESHAALIAAFAALWHNYDIERAIDVYIFCASEHDDESDDGLLSMWRGYGQDGRGAAIVFDVRKIPMIPSSPILIGQVEYRTQQQCREWLNSTLDKFAVALNVRSQEPEAMAVAAHYLFERFKMFALFNKHRGFSEEREWRAVYMRERDIGNRLVQLIDYHKTPVGPQPKFKFRPTSLEDGVEPVVLDDLVVKIIAGPRLADPRSFAGLRRMIEMTRPSLLDRLTRSSTPFRSPT